MQRVIVLIAVVFAVSLAQAQSLTEIRNRFLSGSTTYNGLTIPYRYFVPQGYSANNKYAIITFLHGIGERGSDNVQQLIRAPIILANDTVQSQYKFFIVAPQCPGNLEWQKNSTLRAAVKKAQDDVIAQYSGIDGTNSRYIIGLSLGSFGTWTTVNQFPGVFKKAVPIAGGYAGITASNFRQTKVWAFHSLGDPTVAYSTTNITVNKLRDDGQTVKFDNPNAGHIIDDDALLRYPLVEWLFGDSGTGLPRTPQAAPVSTPQATPRAAPTAPVSTPQATPGAAPTAAPVTAPTAAPSTAPQVAPSADTPVSERPVADVPLAEPSTDAPISNQTPTSAPTGAGSLTSSAIAARTCAVVLSSVVAALVL